MPEQWRDRLTDLALPLATDPGGRAVVLSAHPDDEVLAVGAWLADQTDRDVVFVTATDGEASHPASPTVTADELRGRRPRELVRALGHLGIADPVIHRLGMPDGDLSGCAVDLARAVAPFIESADLVVTPFESDGHPDHDAVGRVALELSPAGATVWRYPIWTWAWTRPSSPPWLSSLHRLDTTSSGYDRKARAIAAFATQVEPLSEQPGDEAVVDGVLLRHALSAPEVVIV